MYIIIFKSKIVCQNRNLFGALHVTMVIHVAAQFNLDLSEITGGITRSLISLQWKNVLFKLKKYSRNKSI